MTFRQKHEPSSFNDLIFKDPDVATILHQYATGHRTKHLILFGPKGSGKSSVAQMIIKSCLPDNFGDATTAPINGRTDRKRDNWGVIMNNWNFHLSQGGRGYAQIDEIDRYNDKQLDQLDQFLEHDRLGTLIMTTNHLEELDEWIVDRCAVVEVGRPTADNMVNRAHAILLSEGFKYSIEEVGIMLHGFSGSLRKMIEALENHVFEKSSVPTSPLHQINTSGTSALPDQSLLPGNGAATPAALTVGGKPA